MNHRHTIFLPFLLIASTLACSINVDTGLTPATQPPLQPSVAAPPTQPPAQPSVAAPPTKPPNTQTASAQPPTTQISTTSDFKPCSGYDAVSPDGKPQTSYGPWATRLMTAISSDGINFTRTNKVISDQADVPDIITMPDGEVRVYYIIMCPDDVRNKIVVAASRDNGTTWVYKKIALNGIQNLQPLSQVDPAVEFTTDNKIRLYFTSVPNNTGGKSTPRTYSAISSDGYNFTVEDGVRFTVEGKEVLDPNVILIGATWHFFSGGVPGSNYHATSTDGLNFKRTDDLSSGNFLMANGIKVEGGYRYYGFVQKPPAPTYITALFSTDGVAWKPETWKFEVDTKNNLESIEVKDNSVTRLSNGQYLMVYATVIPGYPTPQPPKPPQGTGNPPPPLTPRP
ncbi:MAG: hypothetical protein HZC38_15995 [Chloroflexi bacterium]|nr:hypothetical protein [Chloroflexota bacterium]